MMKSDKIESIPVSAAELQEISAFISEENNDDIVNQSYLKWWYFSKPNQSWSFYKVLFNDHLAAIATTNNFSFRYGNNIVKVAMPQKVLTKSSLRGKGLFSAAYFATEDNNIEDGVDFFLTFTNGASTPIFTNKFKYSFGQAPKLKISFSLPHHVFRHSYAKIVDDIPSTFYDRKIVAANNSIIKDASYIQWRYLNYLPNDYLIIELGNRENEKSYAILKERRLKKITFLMLMDFLTHKKEYIKPHLNLLRYWTSKKQYLGLLYLDNSLFKNNIPLGIDTFKRFNFLVKGTHIHRQENIVKESFNFFLGDLDFL